VHAVKSGAVRPAITATTGGVGNVPVSIAEDVIATLLSILSIVLPILVGVFLVLFAVLIFLWLRRRAKKSRSAYN
jgi:predicted Na+-dependent transporter